MIEKRVVDFVPPSWEGGVDILDVTFDFIPCRILYPSGYKKISSYCAAAKYFKIDLALYVYSPSVMIPKGTVLEPAFREKGVRYYREISIAKLRAFYDLKNAYELNHIEWFDYKRWLEDAWLVLKLSEIVVDADYYQPSLALLEKVTKELNKTVKANLKNDKQGIIRCDLQGN